MPDEEKKTVDIDTSGPDAEIVIEETKDESVVETENTETENKEPETDKSFENERETKLEEGGQVSEEKEKKDDEQLEVYSKGVQSRIAKLTRKMREAERREKAALEYAKSVEAKRQTVETKFTKVNEDYVKQFETRVQTGLDSAQKELATAIENADAASQIDAQKKIAALSIDEARLNALKEQQTNTTTTKEEPAPRLSAADPLSDSAQKPLPAPDPRAEDWASQNTWFGKDRAMTYTAFEIHKDLTEREGFDPQTDEYYAEVDKRIRLEFPQKFDTKESQTSKPTQNVASVKRSSNVRSGRQTVRLTSSQVAIAKKLGVPLEEYAKQLNITKEV